MSTIKISQLGNLTTVQGNVIVPVVGNIAGTWTTLQSNVAQLQTYILGTVVTDLANLTASTTANAAVQSGAIVDVTTAWQANSTTQLSQITGANAAIVTANTALKGYVDAQDTTISNSVTGANAAIVTANTAMKGYADAITTAWTSNATTQLSQITGANAAIVTANTIQSNEITAISNSVTGANAAIVTANTALKGYTDAAITTVTNSVTGANAAIVTANTALKGYTDAAITTVTNSVTGANAAITTVTNSVTGANAAITTVTNSVTGANAAIVTANTALKGYVDANNISQLTSINNITNGTTTFGNITPTANVTYNLGNISNQWNNLYVNDINLTLGRITGGTVNGIDYSLLLASPGKSIAMVAANANVAVSNYISVDPIYANIVIYNANTAVTHAWQFTKDGDIKLPASGDILDSVGNSAITSFTMGNAAHWTTPVTTIAAALDQIAERLWTIENPV